MPIDWSRFGKAVLTTVVCRRCDTAFRSHGAIDYSTMQMLSKDPCPRCGSHEMRRISSDPEKMTLTKESPDE